MGEKNRIYTKEDIDEVFENHILGKTVVGSDSYDLISHMASPTGILCFVFNKTYEKPFLVERYDGSIETYRYIMCIN